MTEALLERVRLRMPLGWRQLRHNPNRLFVALGGVAFANVLIFLQLGVMGALFESAVTPLRTLKADILLMSPDARAIGQLGSMSRRRLYQALGVDGVAAASTLQVGTIEIRSPTSIQQASVMVFGVDPEFDGFTRADISAQRSLLRTADVALLDRLTRSSLRPMVDAITIGGVAKAELQGRTVTLAGLFSLGASFQNDGTMIVSDQTFLRLFPRNSAAAINAVLVQTAPGANVAEVAARLRAALPASDTQVMTADAYAEFIKDFMRTNTPIGFVFTFGVVIGTLIGFAIVYQILSADVNDHIREYATFRAMGFHQRYLLGVVFEEALLLAVLGFVPGVVLSLGFNAILSAGTELAMTMPAMRIAFVFGLTFAMCAASGAIATRRLKAADPADVF
ncbi:MAG: ABC transporter permease DevC [Novosphingobium sp.]|jgi:putative ABC transport system permease protein|uniref:ABC transporter permease DevC n=1 Tax=Novosphingobium sp. TaxID=1874826 RepID=UPI0022CC5DC3|nr:ABC transporter permease DevC [Novosphingobium sp.]MCZ8036380.1 ABC transporter permease DevC [Novosphingobium sp.]